MQLESTHIEERSIAQRAGHAGSQSASGGSDSSNGIFIVSGNGVQELAGRASERGGSLRGRR
ncbi:hypothetical protein D3C85_1610310 [compost metagenome]